MDPIINQPLRLGSQALGQRRQEDEVQAMPFDSPMFWPWMMFALFFLWLMFQGRRNTPLTPAQRRRGLVICSIGSLVGVILAVACLSRLATPGRVAAAAVPAAPRQAPAAPVAAPPVQAPQAR